MANLFIRNDQLLARLQRISEREHRPVESVLQSLLDQYESDIVETPESSQPPTSLDKMLRLIQAEPFAFEHSFDAAASDDILNAEFADVLMKRIQGNNGA